MKRKKSNYFIDYNQKILDLLKKKKSKTYYL
jgi:hypothetical protein